MEALLASDIYPKMMQLDISTPVENPQSMYLNMQLEYILKVGGIPAERDLLLTISILQRSIVVFFRNAQLIVVTLHPYILMLSAPKSKVPLMMASRVVSSCRLYPVPMIVTDLFTFWSPNTHPGSR